jgi:hypothetical protein
MSYLLYQSDNLVGVFDDLQKAKDMAQSVINNGWAKNFSVVKYKLNTCLKLTTLVVDEDNNIETEEDVNINELEEDNIKKQKSDIQTKLNLLKIQKDKIEESRTKYDIDLKLYNEFKNKLDEDINFEIPELFQDKYKIFHQLDSQDNLDWETFSLLYKEPDFHGNFTNVFELTNDFETKFLSNLESETEDEDSDEDTTDSDNVIEIVQVLNSSEESSSE